MSKKKKIKAWEQHYANAKEKEFYSTRRIDLLIISISGACIYIVFEILRFINSEGSKITGTPTILLKLSAILAVCAIIVNIFSQYWGFLANGYEARYSRAVINQIEENKDDNNELEVLDRKSRIYSFWTSLSNKVSIGLMLVGIVILVIYNFVTF
ncbi:hypothetical protein PbJCM13498_38970 [Prolixibacter bellariivorans]|uniref:Uncharacterized protein n=1 Tax=Prolixibacter bellariivorans TaxID=314319 RepID=A0A5M4B4I3_9BACT|nr:hypothetical protein [Prolixibacter bellariivorans]GET35034.1 hypothetical protein PbJCM13498_38970 [Prolixibacter bellariivorans]